MAFSAHEGNNKGTGWFGPMGTDTRTSEEKVLAESYLKNVLTT